MTNGQVWRLLKYAMEQVDKFESDMNNTEPYSLDYVYAEGARNAWKIVLTKLTTNDKED